MTTKVKRGKKKRTGYLQGHTMDYHRRFLFFMLVRPLCKNTPLSFAWCFFGLTQSFFFNTAFVAYLSYKRKK
jgi:hypothetical protein